MSFRDKSIKIVDWAGNDLFLGDYDSPEVDKVLDVNRCNFCPVENESGCHECDGTGYWVDFSVHWIDESDKDDCNVYEYINY